LSKIKSRGHSAAAPLGLDQIRWMYAEHLAAEAWLLLLAAVPAVPEDHAAGYLMKLRYDAIASAHCGDNLLAMSGINGPAAAR